MNRRRFSQFIVVPLLLAVLAFAISLAVYGGSPLALAGTSNGASAAAPLQQDVTLTSAQEVLQAQSTVLADLYDQLSPSVVNIHVRQGTGGSRGFPGDFALEGTGSGFVYDAEGHIVTNNHVVEGAETVEVTFSDGNTVDAEVVGTAPNSDLAVIKVDPEGLNLQPLTLGDSDAVRVGEMAIAIGNPFGLQGTMTSGIVSGMHRTLQDNTTFPISDVIQTDAAINPGNSGGPLLNIVGEVIGVNTAITGDESFAGVGFAVPVNLVKRVVPQLIAEGEVQLPWLGIEGVTLTSDLADELGLSVGRGALVQSVVGGGPAETAGLQGGDETIEYRGQEVQTGGDVIVAVNGEAVSSMDTLVSYLLNRTNAGDTITLTIVRDGSEQEIEVTLGERPDNLQ